jgi:hypothetical protein
VAVLGTAEGQPQAPQAVMVRHAAAEAGHGRTCGSSCRAVALVGHCSMECIKGNAAGKLYGRPPEPLADAV